MIHSMIFFENTLSWPVIKHTFQDFVRMIYIAHWQKTTHKVIQQIYFLYLSFSALPSLIDGVIFNTRATLVSAFLASEI